MVNSMPNPIKDYYIAYFDILGYKEFFKQQSEKTPELLNAIHDAISRTNNHIGLANTSPLLHEVAKIDIKSRMFSDNVLLCMDSTDDRHEQIRLFQFIQIVADIQRGFVNNYGLFVRGAITKGALSYNDEYIFGQGLIDVVNMEEAAQYPRIVLSAELADYLWKYHAYNQEDYNHAIEIETRQKNGDCIPEDDIIFYNKTCSLCLADTYYKHFLDRLIYLWPDNNWILCYLNSVNHANIVSEDVKNELLSSLKVISPLDYKLVSMQNQNFDNTLYQHKERLETQLRNFGTNTDIATGDIKSAEIREKILRKYIWVMAFHNLICDYYQKPKYKILTSCNCDVRFLKTTIEVLKDETGV